MEIQGPRQIVKLKEIDKVNEHLSRGWRIIAILPSQTDEPIFILGLFSQAT
jgi:hypothetical protein